MSLVTTEKPIYFVERVGAHTYMRQTEALPVDHILRLTGGRFLNFHKSRIIESKENQSS